MTSPLRMATRRLAPPPTAALASLLTLHPGAGAAQEADEAAVQSAGDALADRVQIPWYDAESDSLQPVPLSDPWKPDLDLSWLGSWINVVLIAIAVLLLLVLAWIIVKILLERRGERVVHRRRRVAGLAVADRVEALPFLRNRSQTDLLGEARRHYEQGNYGEAIVYLFSYQLVELDRRALVRLAKGKTNRQYLREAANVRPLAGLLEQTMIAFEDVFFGKRPLDRRGFEACWNQMDQFDKLLSQARPAV